MMNEIIVLFDGYSYPDGDNQRANCTCTLIKGRANKNIIIDTMTPWDKNKIISGKFFNISSQFKKYILYLPIYPFSALSENNLTPDDIHYCISTHGHSDHIGNNNLFLKANHILGTNSYSFEDCYYNIDFTSSGHNELTQDIKIIATPGHTLGCISIIVGHSNISIDGKVAIAGDLFEREEDIMNKNLWMDAQPESDLLQKENRLKIAKMVEYIIPGHGGMFKVTNEMIKKLHCDFNE